ncbi:hypothetical protein CBL_20860 [Carabus blaptoides fortunei]
MATSTLRNQNQLITLHPPAIVFSCTEINCESALRAALWTCVNQCRDCLEDLGTRPSRHHCTQPRDATPEQQPILKWRCDSCHMSFPSRLGLRNHKRQHRVALRLRDVRIQLPPPHTRRRRRITRRASGSSSTSVEASPIPNNDRESDSPVESPTTTNHSNASCTPPSTPTNSPLTTNFITPPSNSLQSNSSPTSSSHSPTTSNNTIDQPSPPHTTNSTPEHPQNTQHSQDNSQPPSPPHYTIYTGQPSTTNHTPSTQSRQHKYTQYFQDRLQVILDSPTTNANWLLFTMLLDELTTFIQNHCKIPPPNTPRRHNNSSRPSRREVSTRLQRAENTAPGPDRITYSNWKQVDPECSTLTRIFNICRLHRKIPSSWKTSRTILIPKAGDPNVITNWRPIALSATIYKLYSGTLSTRLSKWFVTNKILHPSQKGFLPYDGVLEHNFAIKELLSQARVGTRELCMVYVGSTFPTPLDLYHIKPS